MLGHRILIILLLVLAAHPSYAKGVSPYLPLKLDPVIETDIARLATVAKLPILSKPYHVTTVAKYLVKVKDSHPQLHRRLSVYLNRYQQQTALTHFSAELAVSNGKDNVVLPNSRGQSSDSSYRVTATGFNKVNDHLLVNVGGTHYESGGIIAHGTYISTGWDFLQLDIGFREHWLAPHHEGALLLTTQAEAPLMATISNPELFTSWNIKYELSVGLLDEMNNIRSGGERYSGKPGFLTMHLSLQPLDWWTIGGNRTLMFGGGERSVTLSDVWGAIVDPVNSDNCGGSGTELQDCNEEVGNQIASITNKLDFAPWGFPFSLMLEYGGEDTAKYSNYKLGNVGQNYAIFFPYLTDNTSLNLEWSKFHTSWYVHSIYGDGYTNNGNVMGHWWGDNKPSGDYSPGSAISAKFTWSDNNKLHIVSTYRTAKLDTPRNPSFAERSHELEVNFNYRLSDAFLGLNIYAGQDNQGEDFLRAGVSYLW